MCQHCMNRRDFLGVSSGALMGMAALTPAMLAAAQDASAVKYDWDPATALLRTGKPLRVQPVLMYSTPTPKEATSWKSWGGVLTEDAAKREVTRIEDELRALAAQGVPCIEPLPVLKVKSPEDAAPLASCDADAIIVYPASGSGKTLQACMNTGKNTLLFVRKASGPVYYWYEALSTRYLDTNDGLPPEGETAKPVSVHDVVVDDTDELLWRCRALYAVKNLKGIRIVAVGGPAGKYAENAPQRAQERFGMDIVSLPYDQLSPRIESALNNATLMAACERWTDRYLQQPGVIQKTNRPFIVNSFALYHVFKEIMQEQNAHAFTIQQCMSTIMPMGKTTACLTLGLMNDEGLLAFCESDFVIIPVGILLHYLCGAPVFLHNSTFPHKGMVTCAHCTSPRRMNGADYEPVQLVTHYESDFGAAPKVDMTLGQEVTMISPEFDSGRWIGFKGNVEENPFYEICRSQQNVRIQGDWKRLLKEIRDSHWVMAYGDHLEAAGYAARKAGIRWDSIEA